MVPQINNNALPYLFIVIGRRVEKLESPSYLLSALRIFPRALLLLLDKTRRKLIHISYNLELGSDLEVD